MTTRREALDMAIAALDDPEAIAWLESTRDGISFDAQWIRAAIEDNRFDVDLDIVWAAATEEIPPLITEIENVLRL